MTYATGSKSFGFYEIRIIYGRHIIQFRRKSVKYAYIIGRYLLTMMECV